jgi:tetratricopeptide (TPR) repeat protein
VKKFFVLTILLVLSFILGALNHNFITRLTWRPEAIDEIKALYIKGEYGAAELKWTLLLRKEPEYLKLKIALALKNHNFEEAALFASWLLDLTPQNTEALTICGESFLLNGEKEKGIKVLKNACKIDETLVKARLLLANEALDSEDYPTAESILSGVFPPSSTEALIAKGRLELKTGKTEEARTRLVIAVKLDPSNVMARYYLADTLTELNKTTEALKLLDETAQFVKDDPAMELVQIKAWIKDGSKHTNELVLKLEALSENGNKKLAEEASDILIKLLEKEERFMEALSIILPLIEKTQEVEVKSRRLVKASELAMSVAREYEKKEANDKADLAYSQSILFLREAFADKGMHGGAVSLMSERYIELGAHYFNKAKAATSPVLQKQFYGYAIFNLERATELQPGKIGKAHHILGQILNHLERHQDAVTEFNKVRDDLSGFVESIYTYGESCLKVSRFIDALTAFKEVLTVQEDNWKAQRDLGITYWNLKNTAKAEVHLKNALNLTEADPLIWRYLGKIRKSQRRYSDALICFNKIKILAKDSATPVEEQVVIEANYELQNIPILIKAAKKLKSLGGTPQEDERGY